MSYINAFNRGKKQPLFHALVFAATLFGAMPTQAQETQAAQEANRYPLRTVSMVVPFPAGGATDLVARLVAQKLSEKWRQQVVVDNRPGAGGNVGSEFVARAAPDGYTLLLGVTGSHGINTSLYKNMRFHPLKDFAPLTQAALYPNAIVVNNAVPAHNLAELIALLQPSDTGYNYGSDGTGTASHLGLEMLKQRAKFAITHVPYRGGALMLTDLIGGQIQVGITGLPAAQPFIKSGKLRLIAITTAERFSTAPDYPTVAEQGFANFAAPAWSAFFAPKNTSPALVEKISADLQAVMQDPEVKTKMLLAGSELRPGSPAQLQNFVASEIEKWAESIRVAGIERQ